MDCVGAFAAASRAFAGRVATVTADTWTAATPCKEWDVRMLVNHIAGEWLWIPPLMNGMTVADVGDRFDGDVLGPSPAELVAAAGSAAHAAFAADGAVQRTVHLSYADVTGDDYCTQMALDSGLHLWDLGQALSTGEPLDPELAEFCLAAMLERADQWRGAGVIGPAQSARDGSAESQLVALAGR